MDLPAVSGLLSQSWLMAIVGAVVGALVSLTLASVAIRRSTAEIARQVSELENIIGYVRIQMAGLSAQTEKVEAQADILRSETDRLVASLARINRSQAEPPLDNAAVGDGFATVIPACDPQGISASSPSGSKETSSSPA